MEVSVAALQPDLQIIAPIRDWGMSRDEEMDYARERNLPVVAKDSRFSVDENLWGRSAEAGELEDPWLEPPEEAYTWTNSVVDGPQRAGLRGSPLSTRAYPRRWTERACLGPTWCAT